MRVAEIEFWAGMENIHAPHLCVGRPCSAHDPSEHTMRDWPMLWRGDRGILERICEHGIGHPDPDQFEYWNQTGQSWQATHGCDGCCSNPFPTI